jgi:hypothetical protein
VAPAYDGDGQVRKGASVADITGLLDIGGWPAGMRVTVRKGRPHPGAQLRFTDIDGHRFTCFATDAKNGRRAYIRRRAIARYWSRRSTPLSVVVSTTDAHDDGTRPRIVATWT